MEFQQAYQFPTDTIANRFLNDIQSGTIKGVRAKLHRDSSTVKVIYSPWEGHLSTPLSTDSNDGFDNRLSELDDLAGKYEGCETNL